jgi:hypothetical protein
MRGSLERDKFNMETFLTAVGFGSVCQGGKHRLLGCWKLAYLVFKRGVCANYILLSASSTGTDLSSRYITLACCIES